MQCCPRWSAVALLAMFTATLVPAADHGPVFGLATPTNPKGGWSFDLAVNSRSGTASNLEALLSYGVTQNLKLSVSGPIVFQPDPYPRSSVTTNTPISGDFSGLAWWRFQKKDYAGKRLESTAVAGVLAPGPQSETGLYRGLHSGLGYLVGGVTGVASRSQYVWVGATYQRYAESKGDRRPDLLTYTAVYGYRPLSWRTDYPRWDWRIFGEMTGERAGQVQRLNAELPGSQAQQIFFGPSVLGVYRAIGVEAGMQFPLYHDVGPLFPKERYRFTVNFACFFLKGMNDAKNTVNARSYTAGRSSGTGRSAASGLVHLRHGLNDLRPRGRRGIEESTGSGIGRGELK